MEVLNRDSENYLGVAVTDASVDEASEKSEIGETSHYGVTAEAAFSKQRATEQNLAKYNRGIIPRQEEWARRDKSWYYQLNSPSDNYAGGAGFGGYRAPSGLEQIRQESANSALNRTQQGTASSGQAVRLRTWGIENQQVGERKARRRMATAEQQAAATAAKLSDLQSQLQSASQPGADNLQVLFVLRPGEEGASSPAARNKAQ
jgi:hypothetical protein